MEPIKVCKNTEFDVLYDDGTSRRVHEGILLEVENEKMIFHNGTNRASVLFAAVEALFEVISMLGFVPQLEEYLGSDPVAISREGGADEKH